MQNIFSSSAQGRFAVAKVSICFLIVVSCFFLVTLTSCGDNTKTVTIKPINLSELKGKISSNEKSVLIVDFWATWCPPCRKEIPGFINLYNKYKDKGLEIIGVSLDQGGMPVLQPFVKRFGINYPIFLGNPEISSVYEISGIPTTLIIDKNGKTKSRHVGYVSEAEFEREILALLK
jgi:thiol-disulfide isomerase/thioredoxin